MPDDPFRERTFIGKLLSLLERLTSGSPPLGSGGGPPPPAPKDSGRSDPWEK